MGNSNFLKFIGIFVMMTISMANAQPNGGVPALEVHAPNGKTSILIGSLHIAHDKLRQPAPSILDGAKHFIVEHTATDNSQPTPGSKEAMPAPEIFGKISQGKKARADWAEFITEAQVTQLKQNAQCNKIPPNLIDGILALKSP